jgi:hypothetical protein
MQMCQSDNMLQEKLEFKKTKNWTVITVSASSSRLRIVMFPYNDDI